jgi:hypothetical protein
MYIQDVIGQNLQVYVPAGEYDVPEPLQIQDGTSITFQSGVVLRASFQGPVIQIYQVGNVWLRGEDTVIDGGITTDDPAFEHYHGIDIRGADTVRIESFDIANCGGDGIYIGPMDAASIGSLNVKAHLCEMIGCRRNGVSVVSGEFITLSYIDTLGPGASYGNKGILLEQSDNGDLMNDILLYRCKASSPRANGIHVQCARGGPIAIYAVACEYNGNGFATRSTCPPDRRDLVTGYLKYIDCDGRYDDDWAATAEITRV